MTTITIEKCVFSIHPIYDLYAADSDGNVINIIKRVPHKGNKNYEGYLKCGVRKHCQSGFKNYYVHRFVYECFNGIILQYMLHNFLLYHYYIFIKSFIGIQLLNSSPYPFHFIKACFFL